MAFNKIQPEQIQMPTFFSDSGDLNITQAGTGIQINLSKGLTGDYAFTGSLLTNGKSVFGLANTGTNFFLTEKNCMLFNGSNTQIRGTGNSAFLADESTISGVNNAALNVYGANFNGIADGTSQRNTALHGRNIIFGSSITGSLIMKDFTTSTQMAPANHSFTVNFESGHFFEIGNTYFGNSISSEYSGIFSGDVEILGSGILTGYEIVNTHYLTGYTSGNFVNRCGDEAITGQKTIVDCMRFQTGFQLPAYTGTVQGAGTATAPATGALAISGHTLYVNVGGSWAGIAISGGLG